MAGWSLLGLELPLLVLWVVLGTILASLAAQVADWNDMTDELVWERLAVSIGQFHSLLPRLHGEVIHNLAQLYPALIAPLFASGHVPGDLRNAHILDAWVMSSAAIPAFLLARAVTGRRSIAYLLALVTVCTPWAVYSTILVTEVLAYPLFLWAAFALQRAIVEPSGRRDVVALVAIALAFFARTQFVLLLGVLPVAILAFEIGSGTRLRAALAGGVRRHLVLAWTYGPLVVALSVYLLAGGSLSRFSLYSSESSPTLLSGATAGATTGHAADLAFAVGLVPFLAGTAWLLAGCFRPAADSARHAFACLGATLTAIVLVAVSAWDLTIGSYVIDRYLFYLVPIVILGFMCALLDVRRPRWSLLFPTALVAIGFATHLQPSFLWSSQFPLSMDSPIAPLYKWFVDLGGGRAGAETVLAVGTVVAAGLFLLLARVVRHDTLTAVFAVLLLVAFPLDTAYTFHKLFSTIGHSGRPLTRSEAGVLDWLDGKVGTSARVTAVPYPISSSVFVSQEAWRDLEFWNKSVRYDVHYPTPDVYADAVVWFPNTPITFDPRTGAASASPTPYVVQSINETRFRISGNEQYAGNGVMLIDAEHPWRTDWLTRGLYDDGWTKPSRTVVIRVFAYPGQRKPVIRGLSIQLRPPPESGPRPFTIASNVETLHGSVEGTATAFESIHVCVPAHGFSEVRLSTPVTSGIPGDERSTAASSEPRQGGVLVSDLALSDDLGPTCVPGR